MAWSRDCLEKIEVICANAIPASLEEAEADDDKYHTLTRCTVICVCIYQIIVDVFAIVKLYLVIIV